MLSLKAMLKTQDPDLLAKLKMEGIKAKFLRKGTCITLPLLRTWDSGLIYSIPNYLNHPLLVIQVEELVREKSVVVVCNEKGERLRPYYIPKIGHLVGERVQACFSIDGRCITISLSDEGLAQVALVTVRKLVDRIRFFVKIYFVNS